MKAHGVPWLIRHLNGEIALEEAIAHAKLETRQYTKRQATWFRNQLPEFECVAPAAARAAIEAQWQALADNDDSMRHILQARRIGGAAEHAGDAEFDLAGRRRHHAAHR